MEKERKKKIRFRIFAIILLCIGGFAIAFFATVRLNPEIYRKIFMKATSKTPNDIMTPLATTSISSTKNEDFEIFSKKIENEIFNKYSAFPTFSNELISDEENAFITSNLNNFKLENLDKKQQNEYEAIKSFVNTNQNGKDFFVFNAIYNPNSFLYSFAKQYYFYPTKNTNNLSDSIDISNTYLNKINDLLNTNSYNIPSEKINELKTVIEENKKTLSLIQSNDSTYQNKISSLNLSLDKILNTLNTKSFGENENNFKDFLSYKLNSFSTENKTIDTYDEMLDIYLEDLFKKSDILRKKDKNVAKKMEKFSFKNDSLENLNNILKEDGKDFFSNIKDFNIGVVDSELLKINPSMTIIPSLDNEDMVIVNTSLTKAKNNTYEILAKDSYYGYDYVISNLKNNIKDKILNKNLLFTIDTSSLSGYSNYYRFLSYDKNTSVPNDSVELRKVYNEIVLLLYAKADIMHNYKNLSNDAIANYLTGYGIGEKSSFDAILSHISSYPFDYAKNGISYVKTLELIKKIENKYENLDKKQLNTFLMENAYLPINTIEKNVNF